MRILEDLWEAMTDPEETPVGLGVCVGLWIIVLETPIVALQSMNII